MIKKYFLRITLFTVLACLCLVALVISVISHQPQEIKNQLIFTLAPALFCFVFFDVLLKQIFRLTTGWLWLMQILLLLVAVYVWIVSE